MDTRQKIEKAALAAAPMMRPALAWAAIVVLILLAVVRSAVATRSDDGFMIDAVSLTRFANLPLTV